VPVFSTVWLVMRRLTVGVEEASGAVSVGEIHQFCRSITCVGMVQMKAMCRDAWIGFDIQIKGRRQSFCFISRQLPA
jgi:hypothetical protein